MKQNGWCAGAGAFAGMLLLILDGRTALAGARAGLNLCMQTVIPALFPFLVLSAVVTEPGRCLPMLGTLGRLFRIPRGAEAILVPALLGGYPVGAQAVGQAVREGRLSRKDGKRMLTYCNNGGPGFIFGIAGALFPSPWIAWALWGVHLTAACLTAWILPAPEGNAVLPKETVYRSMPEIVASSVKVMGIICGWVVLFRVFVEILSRWLFWALPTEVQVLLCGVLELTNGCCALAAVGDERLRFTLCSGMLALGGLCVAMQTASVIGELPMRSYFLGKGIQCLVSIALCGCIFLGNPARILTVCLFFAVICLQRQKRSSIPRVVHV